MTKIVTKNALPDKHNKLHSTLLKANLTEKDCNFDTKLQSFSVSNLKF